MNLYSKIKNLLNFKSIFSKNNDDFVITEKKNGDWILQIPTHIAKDMNLTPGKDVIITATEDMIVIEPEENINKTIKKINKNNIHKEIKTGSPVGKEII